MDTPTTLSKETRKVLLVMQKNEVTEHLIYIRLARRVKDKEDSDILLRIADEELRHAKIWGKLTGEEVKPNRVKVFFYTFLATVLGYTFVLKKMEMGEDKAIKGYTEMIAELPQAKQIAADEQRHEQSLLAMLDEQRLQYVGSMVLGLNDALVELSGTLAGLTFALANNRLIALSGLITGISATLSMASSEYLSTKNSGGENAARSSMYTGIAYLFTVAAMIVPYLVLDNPYVSLAVMLTIVVVIILLFTYYISVAKDLPFGKRFGEMAVISLGVAAISFGIGILVKRFLGIDI
ncbi:MAG TPA: VIT1/CCC1 transporter family protein [Sphaerochaeta sp.]|mgnify:CR=1 FL=1|jgi:VIT1/CCC1 family predicted Fe2+/Mn2+ transporter|nr:VIT1/CCC1 transporter family protein [Spirochaetota bacterium]NLV61333.1 rubrerythrin family protein [Spirochaetales bacterium]HOE83857.1 VIT1/CCC1 transporter family protein [Sphaerochaeta sp.]HOQ93821.1 VIT1/CCC1 transporter family protein [Sphaerochaeta sp.]HPK46325.1 VIT1/CCC1 transporter family protein [Sphaerochaeta sp.]